MTELVSIDALVLAPVLAPVAAALVVLAADALRWRPLAFPVGVLGLVAGLSFAAPGWNQPRQTLCRTASVDCSYGVERWGSALQIGILFTALIVLLLARGTGEGDEQPDEPVRVTLLLAATAGGVAVTGARDLASWLIALELATIPVVALLTLRATHRAAHGALTLLMTAVSSFAVLTVGLALWVAATRGAGFTADPLAAAWADPARRAVAVTAGLTLIAGLGFKLSLAPFHLWTPVAYGSGQRHWAALLATTSKLSAVGALLVLLAPWVALEATRSQAPGMSFAIGVIAAVSMTIGAILALRALDPVRLLAWSTISQAGWIVAPLTALTPASLPAASGYALAYAAATLVGFVVVTIVSGAAPDRAGLAAYAGLMRRHRLLGGLLLLALVSLAGLPPGVLGLLAKVEVLRVLVAEGLWGLAVVALANAVIGIAVYLRWAAVLFAARPHPPAPRLDPWARAALTLAGLVLILLTLAPGLVLGLVT